MREAAIFRNGTRAALCAVAALAALAGGLAGCSANRDATASAGARAHSWTRLYVFGDSYSDTGYGLIFGDGPTAVAYLAQSLGLPLTHTKAAGWEGKSLNFAVSGAQTGEGGGGGGLVKQATDFAALVAQRRIMFDPEHTLFYIAGGLNDRQLTNDQSEANLIRVATILKGAGAKHFEIADMPERIPAFAAVGTRLNPMLATLPAKISAELGVDARPSHWGRYYDEVMANAAGLQFVNSTDPCAPGFPGRATNPPPCSDPAHYYFYYPGHPSTAVQRLVGAKLAGELR